MYAIRSYYAPAIKQLEASPIGPMGNLSDSEKTKLPEQPFQAKAKRQFRFPEMTFSFNQWGLSEDGQRTISLVAEELRREKRFFVVSIVITSYSIHYTKLYEWKPWLHETALPIRSQKRSSISFSTR